MRWPLTVLLGWALFVPATGCRNCDLVEAELRTRERELREAREELFKTELFNEGLQREMQSLRPDAAAKISPELASQTYTLKEIVLGRQTGGYDEDGYPGDDGILVVLEPRDPDGHPIKAPGSLKIDVAQVSLEGIKTPLSTWQIPPDQLRKTWQSGLLSTGYFVRLPWKVQPSTTKLRITVRFILPDGRAFEADKDITIRLPPKPKPDKMPGVPPDDLLIPSGPEMEHFPSPRGFPIIPPDIPIEMSKAAQPVWTPGPSSWRREPGLGPLGQAVLLLKPAPGR
jgi:hypothetical protein